MDAKLMDIKRLGIKKIRFTNLLGIAFGKRTVLFSPGKQKHVTFEMKSSKFNVHLTKQPYHQGLREEFFEVDLSLPKKRYAVFEKRMIAATIWLLKQTLISNAQTLAKTGVGAISEMPDEGALAMSSRIKRKELIVDDQQFADRMEFYHPKAIWTLQPGKIYYGWTLNKRGNALSLSGCFLVAETNCRKVIYYFNQDVIRRLMWHYLMAMWLLGVSCGPKTMARINALVKVVTLLKKRFGKLPGIVDIVGAVSPVPRKVVKIYCTRSALPLLKKNVPKEIMGVDVIIKSANLNANGRRVFAGDQGKKNF
jgi:hypothetical protein